jgi:DNA invertase Pin-like site-specific DNA recombinase
MPEKRFVTYFRVSTQRQGRSGLGLDAQRETVNGYLNGGKWTIIDEFIEIESGKRSDNRPKLAEALSLCRIHDATLLVAKLDRLARNVAFISTLMESGVKFVACDLPKANDLTVHIMAAMAEYEAEVIGKRTKEALAAAKAKGTKLGGKRKGWNVSKVAAQGGRASGNVRSAAAKKHANDLVPTIHKIQADGATSLRQIAAALNERGIPIVPKTARKTSWTPTQVSRLLARQAILD